MCIFLYLLKKSASLFCFKNIVEFSVSVDFTSGQNVGARPAGIFSVKVGFSSRDECDHDVKPSHVNFDLLFLLSMPCDTVIVKS